MITTLSGVVDLLRCPRCGAGVAVVERTLRCGQGHAFDIAKQGYANLTGGSQPAHADTAAMVAARADLLASGRYTAISEAVSAMVPTGAARSWTSEPAPVTTPPRCSTNAPRPGRSDWTSPWPPADGPLAPTLVWPW